MMTIAGGGLAGTLMGLEAERRGLDFRVFDDFSGAPATRAAAGLFNPLTGPRFSPGASWDRIVPFYREIEQRLGVSVVQLVDLYRPLKGAFVDKSSFPRTAPGWRATVVDDAVKIEGGGWVDLPLLVDTARARWLAAGQLEPRRVTGVDLHGKEVVWCGGLADLQGEWRTVTGVQGAWQPVRGDVLTVKIPGLARDWAEVGPRFLIPLGDNVYRWGATHESDVDDQGFRPEARRLLEGELSAYLGHQSFKVVDHRWGVRPASRLRHPLVVRHSLEPRWTLFNGFGGRGVAQIPLWLDRVLA